VGGDVDDRAGRAVGEVAPDGRARAGDGEREVLGDQGHDLARRDLVQRGVAEDRGVVDPAAERPARRCDLHRPPEHGVVGRVAGDRPDAAARPVDGDLVHDDDGAVPAQPLGDRPADAAGAAGHHERAAHRRRGTTTSIPLCSRSMRSG
jgi:hypothetical protein